MRSRLVRLAAAVALVTAVGVLAAPSGAASRAPARARLLLFTFSLGFHHLSIPHGTEVLTSALARQGYDVTVSGDPAALTPARLASTDAIVWLNTTGSGDAPFSATVKNAFQDWMRCGGGNVGIHAVAGPLFTNWPAWTRIWGSTEGGEPLTETSVADDSTARYEGWGQFDVTVKVDDHRSPAVAPWRGATSFNARDEWYHWASDPSKVVPDFHQLLGFDGFTDPRVAGQFSGAGYWWDMPLAFTGSFEHTNRDFYTNLGHSTTMFDNPDYVAHVVGGTDWVTQVRPDRACLARHGMRAPAREHRAAEPLGTVQVLAPAPAPASRVTCFLVGQASSTGASLYGGLGLCNGQLDLACSLGAAGPPEVPAGGCSDPGHATAGVEAGEQYVDPQTDLRYAEPPLTVSGPCATATLSGLVLVTWRDQRLSILSVSATGGVVTGTVLPSATLAPATGRSGRPLVVRSTELVGGTVTGHLVTAGCAAPDGLPTLPFAGGVAGRLVTGALAVSA